jgi:hypothetical protein
MHLFYYLPQILQLHLRDNFDIPLGRHTREELDENLD